MKAWTGILTVIIFVLVAPSGSHGQVTVNVSPGDDIGAALQQAGPGGTVILAPGWYNVIHSDPAVRYALPITADLEGITIRGAGPGLDPSSATIIDGEAGFLATGAMIQASGVTVEGITFINFWDEGVAIGNQVYDVDVRNCWMLACDSGLDMDGSITAGFWDEADPDNISELIRFWNCIFARGGDDATDIEGSNMAIFTNCDFYDYDSDLMDHEGNSVALFRNCIIHSGRHSDDFDAGSGWIDAKNCVFFDPRGDEAQGLGGIEFLGEAWEQDSIGEDPLYVNVGPHVVVQDLDFHLQPNSPALTVGKDEQGNPTFAGALGPAQ